MTADHWRLTELSKPDKIPVVSEKSVSRRTAGNRARRTKPMFSMDSKKAYAQVLYDNWQMCESAYDRQNQWAHHFRNIGDQETAKLAEKWRDEWKLQIDEAKARYDTFTDTF